MIERLAVQVFIEEMFCGTLRGDKQIEKTILLKMRIGGK